MRKTLRFYGAGVNGLIRDTLLMSGYSKFNEY